MLSDRLCSSIVLVALIETGDIVFVVLRYLEPLSGIVCSCCTIGRGFRAILIATNLSAAYIWCLLAANDFSLLISIWGHIFISPDQALIHIYTDCMLNLYGSARLWWQGRAHCDGWERNTFSALLVATPEQCFTNSVLTWQGSITVRSVSLSVWSCWGREVP
ncbi:unnamed protein product [Cuscuta campestris]|uniref:Uncharacterized protein n=1 Tax=Cuscuta campestris TaxID=132261 RepID=A0A484LXL3_9ASTE|nr:unnamed protein product [Cuscuta campestris]